MTYSIVAREPATGALGGGCPSQPGWPLTPPLIWKLPDTMMCLSPFGLTS
jgi:hypothetical protein